jgi:hypothetical protein
MRLHAFVPMARSNERDDPLSGLGVVGIQALIDWFLQEDRERLKDFDKDRQVNEFFIIIIDDND